LLGFDADLSAATAYTAPDRSTLLWRAPVRFTPMRAPIGINGAVVSDISATQGPQGYQTARTEGEPTYVNEFRIGYIPTSRVRENDTAGELSHFWANELSKSRKWIMVLAAVEGDSATAQATYAANSIVGPYVADLTDPIMRRSQFARSGGFEKVDAYHPARIPAIVCPEHAA
jgi:hypothetical protein